MGTGSGEEFEENNPGGKYIPTSLDPSTIEEFTLFPPVVKNQFAKDFKLYGYSLGDETYNLFSE